MLMVNSWSYKFKFIDSTPAFMYLDENSAMDICSVNISMGSREINSIPVFASRISDGKLNTRNGNVRKAVAVAMPPTNIVRNERLSMRGTIT